MMRFQRHMLSGQSEDLDKSILHFAESIFLPPRLWSKHGLLILKSLFFLACALLKRSQLSQQYKDAIFAANYLRYLLNLPFNAPRHLVMTMLVEALDVQIKLEAGNVMQNIEEMTPLCRELLTSDVPDVVTTRPVILLVGVVGSKVRPWVPDLPLNQLIECLRLATLHKPELRIARSALAVCLSTRYFMTFVNDDYEEASSILDEIISSRSPGDGQDEFVALIQRLVTAIAVLRSDTHNTPEYSEEAIYRARTFLAENPSNPFFNHSLEDIAKKRFNFFGFIEGLKASSSDTRPVPVPSVAEEGYRDPKLGLLRAKAEQVEGLLSGIDKNEITKIDEAIEIGRSILASSPPHLFSLLLSDAFAGVFLGAFKRTNKIEYLNESISTLREALDRPYAQHLRFTVLGHLSLALFTRFVSFPDHCAQDVDEALVLLSRCANDGHASLHDRFQFACRRASLARGLRHACISAAYEDAMSLTQDILLFAPTLQLQHTTLVTSTTSDHPRTRSMPLDYASYQIELGELEEAIMTLERGRALLWSEMRHLRASIDQLLLADPQLGCKFAANSRDLEELTKSIPPSHKLSMDDVAADSDDLRAVDPFGRLLVRQRQLLKERDDLISKIRALPGFDSFLASPSFDVLRSAASSGPIIIINHSAFRSDILILLHNTSPSLVATPADFYQRANALKNKLLDARNKYGPSSSQYDETLADVLKELYDLVGKPVIDRLRELNVPDQSRVWWCPTSVFCSLPLHAMGPIPSDDSDDERYFLDLYIPSYTPTLSALIHESDPHEPTTSNLPSLLLVSHFDVPSPDVPLSDVCEDVKIVQGLRTRLPIKSLISEHATPSSVLTNLQNHQFVHFICHGTLEPKKPFDAGFELHSNARLTLLEIVRHSLLPSAEFAFLAACHTAELTDGSSADEGLHLAAAAQYCGFRSVVGTMWAMANVDGADLAKWFYRSVFARKERGEAEAGCYYRRSAGALREAVRKLRKKRGITLERWVNFVHYGA
jgi:CHAT domain-containing protein